MGFRPLYLPAARARRSYDDIDLDWDLEDGANGSDANGAAPTYPKINGSCAQAFSNFITNFKSALKAAGLATTISIPAIPSNVNGSNCSGGNTGAPSTAPDHDGSAANASFMSTQGINTSGFTLGGSDWYQMLGNWLAAP